MARDLLAGLGKQPTIMARQDVNLGPEDESDFQTQFRSRARRLGLNEDPNDPLQLFNSRKAYLQLKQEGKRLVDQDHLGSIGLKRPGHPTQFGFDTPDRKTLINRITDKPATQQDIEEATTSRRVLGLPLLNYAIPTQDTLARTQGRDLLAGQPVGIPSPSRAREFGEIRAEPVPTLPQAIIRGAAELPSGIQRELTALQSAILNPIQTAESLGMVAKGVYSAITGGNEPEERIVTALKDDLESRWGSYDQFKFAVAEQPERVLSELSIVIGGAAGLSSKAAKVAGFTKTARALEAVAATGRALDPIRLAGLAVTPITESFSFVGKKIAAHLLSGAGEEFVEQAFRLGPGKPRFLDALRGRVPMSEFLDDIDSGFARARELRGLNYQVGLSGLSKLDDPINFNPIQDRFIRLITGKNYGVRLDPTKPAGLDFGRSVFSDAKDIRTIRSVAKDISNWASDSSVQTGRGLDILKRRLDAKFAPNSVTKAVTTAMRSRVKKAIVDAVPGYRNVTGEYSRFTTLLHQFEDALAVRSTAKANTTLGKLTNLMRQNNTFAQEIVRNMDQITGGQLIATAAGLAGRPFTAKATIGRRIQEAAGIMGLLARAEAKLVGVSLISSPRILGEFLNVLGKTARGIQRTQQTLGASIPASLVELERVRKLETPPRGLPARQRPILSELE